MLNLRQVDDKFVLSGGWTDVPEDAKFLARFHFKAVLDVQFTAENFIEHTVAFIEKHLKEVGIEYFALPMVDGENSNLGRIFDITRRQLEIWDEKYTNKNDRILVKCGVGVSRSVACLIHYYCTRDRLRYTEAKRRIASVDRKNYGGLPISIDGALEKELKRMFPDEKASAFGEVV